MSKTAVRMNMSDVICECMQKCGSAQARSTSWAFTSKKPSLYAEALYFIRIISTAI